MRKGLERDDRMRFARRMSLTTVVRPLRHGEAVDLEFEATDASGIKFSFSVPLLDNQDLRRIHIVTWDGDPPNVTPALLAEVRRKAREYVDAHETELAELLRR